MTTTQSPGRRVPRALGPAIFVVALVVAALVAAVAIPRLAGSRTIYDAATLPRRINVCGRDWNKGGQPLRTLAEIRVRDGVEPVVVDPGLFAACPMKPCTDTARPCPFNTVVYVRVGEDAYLDFELVGGP